MPEPPRQRYYVYDPVTEHWRDAHTCRTVEWHEWGDYRFSFDIRPDASRFIIIKSRRLALPNGEVVDAPKLLAQGLIDPECSHGAAPICIFDEAPAEELPPLLPIAVADAWAEMAHRLRELRR